MAVSCITEDVGRIPYIKIEKPDRAVDIEKCLSFQDIFRRVPRSDLLEKRLYSELKKRRIVAIEHAKIDFEPSSCTHIRGFRKDE